MEVLFPVFEKYGIQATKASGWVPNPVEKMRQIAEFFQNFPKDVKEDVTGQMNEI